MLRTAVQNETYGNTFVILALLVVIRQEKHFARKDIGESRK